MDEKKNVRGGKTSVCGRRTEVRSAEYHESTGEWEVPAGGGRIGLRVGARLWSVVFRRTASRRAEFRAAEFRTAEFRMPESRAVASGISESRTAEFRTAESRTAEPRMPMFRISASRMRLAWLLAASLILLGGCGAKDSGKSVETKAAAGQTAAGSMETQAMTTMAESQKNEGTDAAGSPTAEAATIGSAETAVGSPETEAATVGNLETAAGSSETRAAATGSLETTAAGTAGAEEETAAGTPETATTGAADETVEETTAVCGFPMAPGSSTVTGGTAAAAEDDSLTESGLSVSGNGWSGMEGLQIMADASTAFLAESYQAAYSPGVSFNTEEYNYIAENGFKNVRSDPLSTFSVDVDTASYTNIRRFLRNGEPIPEDAVRIEEMLNYFDYDYPEPAGEDPFSVTVEYADCPWNADHRLLMIGLKAQEIDFRERPASNFVFLLDVSGSMYSNDKLPLVQKAFTMLAENLNENDCVSIVTYAGYESVVLDGVSGSETAKIAAAIGDLEAGGSTAGEAGIQKAYELAEKHFIPGGNNRVILATDGDLNVGISSEGELTRLIQEKKQSGVHLSVLGVGTGNIKDNKMEALADNGDGNYSYIDSIFEAKKVLVDEMGGTLVTVAKDVKIQVEFNPNYIGGYRLVGYENRVLNNEDFDDDAVDAGEIGAGHTVMALYEIIPAGGEDVPEETDYRYQVNAASGNGSPAEENTGTASEAGDSSEAGETGGLAASPDQTELLTVSLRYKEPSGDTSKLLEYPVEAAAYRETLSENLSFAAAVAEFGMVLRDSEYKGTSTYDSVLALAEPCVHADSDDYRKEFLSLVETARRQAPEEELSIPPVQSGPIETGKKD